MDIKTFYIIAGGYENGNTRKGVSETTMILYDTWSTIAVPLVTPLVLPNLIPLDLFKILNEVR